MARETVVIIAYWGDSKDVQYITLRYDDGELWPSDVPIVTLFGRMQAFLCESEVTEILEVIWDLGREHPPHHYSAELDDRIDRWKRTLRDLGYELGRS